MPFAAVDNTLSDCIAGATLQKYLRVQLQKDIARCSDSSQAPVQINVPAVHSPNVATVAPYVYQWWRPAKVLKRSMLAAAQSINP